MVLLAVNIIGLSVMALLVDLLTVDGETSKYVKVVFNLIVVLVIGNTLFSFLGDLGEDVDVFSSETIIDAPSLRALYDNKRDYLENYCEMVLEGNNYGGAEISIEYSDGAEWQIVAVSVDLNSVTEITAIDQAFVTDTVAGCLGIDGEVVRFV